MKYRIERGTLSKSTEAGKLAGEILAGLAVAAQVEGRGSDPAGWHLRSYHAERVADDGTVDGETARAILADALHHGQERWLARHASDVDVVSDGTRVRWQEVQIFVNDDDRTLFDGLWLWELWRVGEARYQLAARRLMGQAWTEFLQSAKRARRPKPGACRVCGEKLGLAARLIGRETHPDCTLLRRSRG